METINRHKNQYLAIAFGLGIFWGGLFIWLNPKMAIPLALIILVITYNILCFFGGTYDD